MNPSTAYLTERMAPPASWDTLLRQASMTADTYLKEAKRSLDELGLDYTAQDVIALATVAAMDFNTMAQVKANQELLEDAIDKLPIWELKEFCAAVTTSLKKGVAA